MFIINRNLCLCRHVFSHQLLRKAYRPQTFELSQKTLNNHYSPFESVFAMLRQVNILVFLPVWIGVVEQGDGPETSKAQQPENQQDQLHDQK